MVKMLRFTFQLLRPHAWSVGLCAVTGILCIVVTYLIVWPAYKNPIARMYTSKIGYSSVIRKTGGAFPVTAAEVQSREIVGKFIGEGLVQSEPIQVSMIGMARIFKVHATEGQRVRKGEVIVELDDSRVRLKIESAKAALQTARAELDRVRFGTVNVLQEERPDILSMRAEAATESASVADQLLQIANDLAQSGTVSKMELAEVKLASIRANLLEKERKLAAEMAASGRKNSIEIAESAIREAEMTLAHRLSELEDYTSMAPADGIVERVLVHEGEYNQDPGRPAVLLASGLWFECYLDQTALNRVQIGDNVEVRLSAYQDILFQGKIERVRPLVNFALGGPETNRPIRPLGTGAPEWPATFAVRILLQENGALIVPGLTGYATVIQKRTTLSVPRGTVMGVSGHRGIVFVIDSDGKSFKPRNVVTGLSDNRYVEITEGLKQDEIVIADGYQVLKPGDRIAIKDGFEPKPKAAFIGVKNASLGAAQNVSPND
jgi:multidrug resistance efflux pump